MRRHHGRRFGGSRHGKPLVFGTTKVGERGQIVIPKEAREKFDIKPGDSLFVIGDEDKQGLAIVKADLLEGFALQILQGVGYFSDKDQSGDDWSDSGEEDDNAVEGQQHDTHKEGGEEDDHSDK